MVVLFEEKGTIVLGEENVQIRVSNPFIDPDPDPAKYFNPDPVDVWIRIQAITLTPLRSVYFITKRFLVKISLLRCIIVKSKIMLK